MQDGIAIRILRFVYAVQDVVNMVTCCVDVDSGLTVAISSCCVESSALLLHAI